MMMRFLSSKFAIRKRPLPAAGAFVLPVPQIEVDNEQRYRPIERWLVKRMLAALAPYKWQYLFGICIGLVHVLLDQQGPRFMRSIINASLASQVSMAIVYWALTFVGSVLLQRWTILVMTRAGESVQFDFRRKLFDHLQELSMSYYDKTKLGRIISRMTSDIQSMREVNVWGIFQVVAWSGMMLFSAAMMAIYADWRLLLSVAWLAPVLFFANHLFLKRASIAHQITREGWTRVSTNMAENITGMRVVTAFNRQDPNLSVFNRLQADNTANNVGVARINGIYQPVLQTIGFIGKAIILLYGGALCATGRMLNDHGLADVGGVVMAYMY